MKELSRKNRTVGIEQARKDFEELHVVTKTLAAAKLVEEADGNTPSPNLTNVDFLVRVFRTMKRLEELDGVTRTE